MDLTWDELKKEVTLAVENEVGFLFPCRALFLHPFLRSGVVVQ